MSDATHDQRPLQLEQGAHLWCLRQWLGLLTDLMIIAAGGVAYAVLVYCVVSR